MISRETKASRSVLNSPPHSAAAATTVLDCVREVVAPFAPSEVCEEFADVLKTYKIRSITGDRYAGEWVVEQFGRVGIQYEASEMVKSEIYAAESNKSRTGGADKVRP